MAHTTFVVGAGASVELGLPLGGQLLSDIGDLLDSEFRKDSRISTLVDGLPDRGANYGAVLVAATTMRAGLVSERSIDRFLHARRKDPLIQQIGKVAIAKSIIDAEAKTPLAVMRLDEPDSTIAALRTVREKTWLGQLNIHLCGRHSPETISTAFDDVSFVVFNYDRCLEQYLLHALRFGWQLKTAEAVDIVRKTNIIHVYGSLGELPAFGGPTYAAFGAKNPHLSVMSAGIRTFTEQAEDGVVSRIRSTIAKSNRIIFLGFGFDKLNLSVLFPDGLKVPTEPHGTMFFRDEDEDLRREAEGQLFRAYTQPRPATIANLACAEYLRRKGGLLFPL